MQIRLTVLASRGGKTSPAPCDVIVTAPSGTVLAAVTDGLASAAAASESDAGTGADRGHETVPVYAGTVRLDPLQQLLGSPPLIDGAEISLYGPAHSAPADPYGPARARLHVVAGPDAGGVHLLHGGRVSLGRSAEADVPLDDPDVSRLHCAVTVTDSGELTVTDLESTNGTTVDAAAVESGRTVPLAAGATLHLGESSARVETDAARTQGAPLSTTPDGEGHLRLTLAAGPPGAPPGPSGPSTAPTAGAGDAGDAPSARRPVLGTTSRTGRTASGPHRDGPQGRTVSGGGPSSLTPTPAESGETAETDPAGEAAERGRGGWGGWARRLTAWRDAVPAEPPTAPDHPPTDPVDAAAWDDLRPDPATVLLTALGPGPRLWERGPEHPDALTVRIGSAHRRDGRGEPVTVDLRGTGSLGLAGPRARLTSLARSVLAQLAALHAPGTLEIVLLAADPARELADRTADWGWLGWLPHLRPAHGQDCRLLVAYDRDQAAARTTELTRRLNETPSGSGPYTGPRTLLVVDGDPGPAPVREAVSRLASEGMAAGVHVLCLAETPSATPASPLDATVRAAGRASTPFQACATYALLSGAVATAVRIVRPGRHHADGTVATMDGVSPAWAERFARALAPLREADAASRTPSAVPRAAVSLPQTCRLLDELGLARATPTSILARWAAEESGPAARFTLGAGPRGPAAAAFSAEHGHLRLTGPAGAGKTELLRSLAASLAAGTRPDRLALALVDGDSGSLRDGGLGSCADLPHVEGHLVAGDPVRMRDFAQSLTAELKHRAELLGDRPFPDGTRVVAPRRPTDTSSSPAPLRRVVVLVDDFDTLVDPALGNPGRPSAGSVVRALEAIARDGARLGVHLVTASGRPDRTADTAAVRNAAFHVHLTGREGDDPLPGRGTFRLPDTAPSDFQAGRITGRIPRTSTLRPTIVPLDWSRAGDPPTRRPVRELGNGPTDLALLTSALDRAAHTTRPTTPTESRRLPAT